MKYKAYKRWRSIVLLLVLVGMGVAIYFDLVVIGILAVGGGMVINSFFKSQVTDTVDDERLGMVSEKAARTSFVITLPIMGLTSVALLIAGEGPFYFLESLGIVLGYVTCVMVGVYLISWVFFNKQSGG